ncbi:hypothetical protein M6D81_23850 [Paenibacillus sp. J5C_2022]|uniref:hypothetical protein n=1 Tax=Paenibacillus sp. J5C2022 TaxID=2977129 RepID=UPI0021CE2499|nr:hypothetical protein [Paenibacillus sp. J5C2022]MCU6711737.1 hypothetical protein [Paenibacillus sp. J5C2022]
MNFVAWMIVACEIAFWVVIVTGLITRYLLRKERLGFLLLALTPLIDVVLLAITGLDLYRGAVATSAHAISAVYIGVSIVFGKSIIAWADERFRYYIVKQGDKPMRRYGYDYARQYLKSWLKHVLAYAIGIACLFGLTYLVQEPERSAALTSTIHWWTRILGIDLLIAIAYFIWPKKAPVH